MQVNTPLFVSELWVRTYPLVNIYLGKFVSIGKRLKEERERLGLNQTDFAAAGGVGRKSQFNYEEDERRADTAYLAAIAAAGADVRYIITGHREGPAPEVLTSDERELLALFRAASLSVKAAAIGALQGGTSSSGGKVIIHGRVGQQVEKIEGGVKIDMRSKK